MTSDRTFELVSITLGSTGLAIFVRIAGRSRMVKALHKNDLAFGIDLMMASLMLLATSTVYESIVLGNWLMISAVSGIWATSMMTSRIGWKSKTELKTIWGIVVPDLIGFIYFYLTIRIIV
jgi:hypothetical protein